LPQGESIKGFEFPKDPLTDRNNKADNQSTSPKPIFPFSPWRDSFVEQEGLYILSGGTPWRRDGEKSLHLVLKILKVLLLFVLVLGIGLITAWHSGHFEAVAIDLTLRTPMEENLQRQRGTPAGYPGRRPVDLTPFSLELDNRDAERTRALDDFLETATILDIQARLVAGTLTSTELAVHQLERIRRYDGYLQSVSEIDPQLLKAARELDAERSAGRVRGAMHGVPVLLKDNIASKGRLHTTAGAIGLRNLKTGFDAPLVRNLRENGALIVGKSAMSEWANYTSSTFANGFSALGGQVRNPYGDFDVSGSSSGSAVAVAAGLVTVAVGSETWGSLVFPASQNAIVAVKPTFGLVSNEGMIPIISSRDTAGPMARSVTDAAILLDVLVGSSGSSYQDALQAGGLAGLRLGLVSGRAEAMEGDDLLMDRAIAAIEGAGGVVVELPPTSIVSSALEFADFSFLANHEFARGVDAFLADTPSDIKTLADVIAFNKEDPSRRVPFGQDLLIGSVESSANFKEVEVTKERSERRARAAIDGLLKDAGADLLITMGPAIKVPFCAAGYPALNLPAGRRPSGEPVGLTFVGRSGEEALLIRAAFAFEQETRARSAPDLTQ
jgi:amidase